MADPVTWASIGTALSSATVGTAATATAAATSGLLGAGGALSLGTTLGTLATVGSLVGGVSSMVSSGEASYQNEKAAAEQAANSAVETEQALAQQKRQNYLNMSANSAAAGANTGNITGTALDLIGDSAAQGALDLLTIQRNGSAAKNKIVTDARNKTSEAYSKTFSKGADVLTSGAKLAKSISSIGA